MSFGIEGLHIASKVVEGLPEFQAIWKEEQKSEYDLNKPVEEVKNAEVMMATLNGLPGS